MDVLLYSALFVVSLGLAVDACDPESHSRCKHYFDDVTSAASFMYERWDNARLNHVCGKFKQGMICYHEYFSKCQAQSTKEAFSYLPHAKPLVYDICKKNSRMELLSVDKCLKNTENDIRSCKNEMIGRNVVARGEHDRCCNTYIFIRCADNVIDLRCGKKDRITIRGTVQKITERVHHYCEQYHHTCGAFSIFPSAIWSFLLPILAILKQMYII